MFKAYFEGMHDKLTTDEEEHLDKYDSEIIWCVNLDLMQSFEKVYRKVLTAYSKQIIY